jgi:hypothetical protein
MKKIRLSELRAIIKEELRRNEISEGFLDFFWNRKKEEPLSSKESPQNQESDNQAKKDDLYSKMYKIMSALTTIYSRGRRQKEITDSAPFKALLNSGVFKIKNQWELYKIIADSSGSPDENDPYYKFAQINVGKTKDVKAPNPEVDKGATERGKNILGRASHLMKSVDDLDRKLSTESLRRIIRQIIKES